jgi:hypothetical protein
VRETRRDPHPCQTVPTAIERKDGALVSYGTRPALPTLDNADTRDLDALNRRLRVWIEEEYHHAPHRGLGGVTPIDRWAATSADIQLPTTDVTDLFLFDEKRKVPTGPHRQPPRRGV